MGSRVPSLRQPTSLSAMLRDLLPWRKCPMRDKDVVSSNLYGEYRKRDECGGDGRSHNSHNSGGEDDERNLTEIPVAVAGQRNDKHSNPPTQFSVNVLLLDFFEKRSLGTWKRSRNHQFSHKKDRRGFKSLKKFDLFSSSPSLLDKSSECSDQDNIRKSSLQLEGREVLQFTSYELHGSLITINFAESQPPVPSHLSDNVKIPAQDPFDNDHHSEPESRENNEASRETSVRDTGPGPQDFVIESDPQSGQISSSDNQ